MDDYTICEDKNCKHPLQFHDRTGCGIPWCDCTSPAKLYECHVTVRKPVDSSAYDNLASTLKWKTSSIDRDPVLGDDVFFYFTSYGSTLDSIKLRMERLSSELGEAVIRKKIELIVFDTKRGDK